MTNMRVQSSIWHVANVQILKEGNSHQSAQLSLVGEVVSIQQLLGILPHCSHAIL